MGLEESVKFEMWRGLENEFFFDMLLEKNVFSLQLGLMCLFNIFGKMFMVTIISALVLKALEKLLDNTEENSLGIVI